MRLTFQGRLASIHLSTEFVLRCPVERNLNYTMLCSRRQQLIRQEQFARYAGLHYNALLCASQ